MEKTIEKKTHLMSIKEHANFIEVTTILPQDLYMRVVMRSFDLESRSINRFDYERFVINDFKQHIFDEDYIGMHNFTYPDEFYQYMSSKGQSVEKERNEWFKKVCFDTNIVNKDSIYKYIEQKSEQFEKKNSYIIPSYR